MLIVAFVVCTVLLFVGGAVTLTWMVSTWCRGKHVDPLLVNWHIRLRAPDSKDTR
jgi:hypothetical protein